MYLSRIKLDTRKRNTMIALSNPQKFHGAIESSFPGERERNLWRLDELGGDTYLLILSKERPDLAGVARQFGYDESFEMRDYDKLLERITQGSRWQFRLTANPTICKKKNPDVKRGEVMAHITVGHQEEWLEGRAEKYGFGVAPDEFRVTGNRSYSFSKQGERRRVTLLSVTYDGILTVTDPEKFRAAMVEGIGRGKAYGNGLLTIIRTNN